MRGWRGVGREVFCTLVRRFWHSLHAVEALFILASSGGNACTTSGWPFTSRTTAWGYGPRSNGPKGAPYVAHRVRRPVWVEAGGRRKKGEDEEAKKDGKRLTVLTNRRLKRDKPRSQT